MLQISSNLCKSSEILKQCHDKWWLDYRIYGSVSYSFSCNKLGTSNSQNWGLLWNTHSWIWNPLAYVPADIHCCHRWSDITDGTWSPLCNAGGIQFYIFRHKLGCTPWPIWSLALALCTFGIFGTRFPSLHALVAPALKCIPSIFWWM